MVKLEGYLDPRFAPVAEAFMAGFSAGRDVGAAVAVTVAGDLMVDLWHGHADRRKERPWQRDTLVCMFSVTKAMASVCLLQAVERGLIDLDTPVSCYWPEFASSGKESISLRQLMCHQAGLVGFHHPVDRDILYDWPRFTRALEAEWPWWEPGSSHGYHARTFGFLLGEVLRRSSGRGIGAWFASEVAAPLGLDFKIGLPESDLPRCADILPARIRAGEAGDRAPAMEAMMRDFGNPATPTGAAFQNPAMGAGYMNTPAFRRAEIPAANGHGTARAAARMYDQLGTLISPDLLRQATSTHSIGPDQVLKSNTHFGLGFMLYHEDTPIGIRPGSYGHAGAGGSMAFHDPELKLSFCFAMNQMEGGVVSGGTSANLVAEAVYGCMY